MRRLTFAPLILGLVGIVAACKPAPVVETPPDPDDALYNYLQPSKDQMGVLLKDADTARYKDVWASRFVAGDGQSAFVFCGNVNSKNGMGAYTGYQRFVATGDLAEVEEEYSDFGQLWNLMCANPVRKISF